MDKEDKEDKSLNEVIACIFVGALIGLGSWSLGLSGRHAVGVSILAIFVALWIVSKK